MNGWIIYTKDEAKRNRWFIEHFIEVAKEYGHTLTLKLPDEINAPYPDFAIARAFDYKINEHLEKQGVKVFNNSFLAKIANDKALCYKFMEKHNIPIMPTFYEMPKSPTFPLIVKSASGHGGTQVVMAKNKAELKAASKAIPDAVYQDAASDLGKDLRVYVIANEIVAAMLRESKTDFRSNYCLGGKASVYPLSDEEKQLINKVINILTTACCENIAYCGIDFVFDNGKIIFNELEDAVGARMLYDLTKIDIIKEWFKKIKI